MSPLAAHVPALSLDYLVVGEGEGDASFISHLCSVRGVELSAIQIENAGGSGKFKPYLEGLRLRPNFDRLRGLLVIGDNDDTPEENFNRIRGFLKRGKLPYPDQPLRVARFNGTDPPAVVVMMLPYTVAGGPTRGSLDTMLLVGMNERNAEVAACIDAFRGCLTGGRTRNQEDKFRLRSFLAALWAEDPNIGLQFALSPTKGLVDLAHHSFDEVAEFLGAFTQMCEPAGRR